MTTTFKKNLTFTIILESTAQACKVSEVGENGFTIFPNGSTNSRRTYVRGVNMTGDADA